jgi:hypothetical protein
MYSQPWHWIEESGQTCILTNFTLGEVPIFHRTGDWVDPSANVEVT